MKLLKISICLAFLIIAAGTSANSLGLSQAELNSLLNPHTAQPKAIINPVKKTEAVDSKKVVKKVVKKTNKGKSKRISCKSFNHQSEAQQHFDMKKKSWKALDRDKDGEPCECLKGGSRYGESICKRWRKKSGKNK